MEQSVPLMRTTAMMTTVDTQRNLLLRAFSLFSIEILTYAQKHMNQPIFSNWAAYY